MVVNTAHRGGPVAKSFRVYSNDSRQPQAELVIAGNILAFAEVNPNHVTFAGRPGETLVQEVRIVPRKDYPFTIKQARAKNGLFIRLDLKPLGKKASEAGYLLTITSSKKEPGGFFDSVELQTDSKDKPIINIPVNGRIQEEKKND